MPSTTWTFTRPSVGWAKLRSTGLYVVEGIHGVTVDLVPGQSLGPQVQQRVRVQVARRPNHHRPRSTARPARRYGERSGIVGRSKRDGNAATFAVDEPFCRGLDVGLIIDVPAKVHQKGGRVSTAIGPRQRGGFHRDPGGPGPRRAGPGRKSPDCDDKEQQSMIHHSACRRVARDR